MVHSNCTANLLRTRVACRGVLLLLPTWKRSEWLSSPSSAGLRTSLKPAPFCSSRDDGRRACQQRQSSCKYAWRVAAPHTVPANHPGSATAGSAGHRRTVDGVAGSLCPKPCSAQRGHRESIDQQLCTHARALAALVRRQRLADGGAVAAAAAQGGPIGPLAALTFSPECSISTVILRARCRGVGTGSRLLQGRSPWAAGAGWAGAAWTRPPSSDRGWVWQGAGRAKCAGGEETLGISSCGKPGAVPTCLQHPPRNHRWAGRLGGAEGEARRGGARSVGAGGRSALATGSRSLGQGCGMGRAQAGAAWCPAHLPMPPMLVSCVRQIGIRTRWRSHLLHPATLFRAPVHLPLTGDH